MCMGIVDTDVRECDIGGKEENFTGRTIVNFNSIPLRYMDGEWIPIRLFLAVRIGCRLV